MLKAGGAGGMPLASSTIYASGGGPPGPATCPARRCDPAVAVGVWSFKTVAYSFDGTWQVPVSPMAGSQTLRHKIPASLPSGEVVLYLSAGDAGDGREGDVVVWKEPRLEIPGRPPLCSATSARSADTGDRRRELLGATSQIPGRRRGGRRRAATGEGRGAGQETRLQADALAAWLDYLGLAGGRAVKIDTYFARKISRSGGYEFIQGWGFDETPA